MSDGPLPHQSPARDGAAFRALIGLICVTAGLGGLALLFFIEVPARNENALLLALGVVLGWGSSVVASEYGASSSGRKAADAALNQIGKGVAR